MGTDKFHIVTDRSPDLCAPYVILSSDSDRGEGSKSHENLEMEIILWFVCSPFPRNSLNFIVP